MMQQSINSLISIIVLLTLILFPQTKQQVLKVPIKRSHGIERNSSRIDGINLAASGTTELVSVGDDWSYANGHRPSISGDGRYVAFNSSYGGLIPDDTNGRDDVFVKDRETGQIERVSVRSDGSEGEGFSHTPSISADGRYVAFLSGDSTLVPGDNNFSWDVFVNDRQTGITQRVSVASDGTEANGISYNPSISGDGRYIAFETDANNLVSNDTNPWSDIFVHDRDTGQTERVSVTSDGLAASFASYDASISADGQYVVFSSSANNLDPLGLNSTSGIFIHDRVSGQTDIVSVASDGTRGNNASMNPSISPDGRYVAFESLATNLAPSEDERIWDIFVHDRQTGQTKRISVASDGTPGNDNSEDPSISEDGRYIAFLSYANNLVSGDTNLFPDVFVHDLQTNQTERISVANDGSQADGYSFPPSISFDGDSIAFASNAGNLICVDPNPFSTKTFVRDRSGNLSTISGRVTHTNNTPIANVTISDDAGHSTKTNTDGYYFFNDVVPCRYTITPSKDIYYFSPDSVEFTTPPSANDLNFLGIGPTFIPVIIK